jgi:hypothetical protein
MDIPPHDELYCGQSSVGCNECAPRDGQELTCYRLSSEQQFAGVCIKPEHCPQLDDCVDKCSRHIGCFGDDMCGKDGPSPAPTDCDAFCGRNTSLEIRPSKKT